MRKQKVFRVVLVMALVFAMCAEVFLLPFKAVNAKQIDSTVTVTSSALKKAKANITMYLNGEKLKKKAFAVTGKVDGNKETVLYVPSKSFVLAGNGDYTQKGKKVTVKADNVTLSFTQGKNSYVITFTDAAGSKQKYTFKYGKSIKKSKQIYIPIGVFTQFAALTGNYLEYTLDTKAKTADIIVMPEGGFPVTGGWGTPESIEVPETVAAFFAKQNEIYKDDEQIIPVLVLQEQVVAGMNYKLLCRISNPSQNVSEVYGIIEIYVDLNGEINDISSEIKSGIETNINGLPGGWSQPDSVAFPAEYTEMFASATNQLDGVDYKPIAILATQVVNGVNLCILCEATVVYPGATPQLVLVYAYVNPMTQTGEITDIESLSASIDNGGEQGNNDQDDQKGFYIPGSENAVEGVDYMCMSGNFYTVTSLAGLAKVCEMEMLPTGEFKTNIACIQSDMILDFEISTMGNVTLANNATLVIEKGGVLEADVYVGEGSQIIVKDGGKLQTTQGGDIYNNGEITIEKGAELKSQMGGSIWNAKPGIITMNGNCYIGCIEYANEKQEMEKHIWFINDGKVKGNGSVFIYAPLGKDENPDNWGYYQSETEKMLDNGMTVGIFE